MPNMNSYRLFVPAIVMASVPTVALAAAPRNLVELSTMMARMFNSGAAFLVFLAFILYMGSLTVFLYRKESGEIWGKEYKSLVLWGIGALFVMVSVWGIVRILQQTLFGTGTQQTNVQVQGGGGQLQFPI